MIRRLAAALALAWVLGFAAFAVLLPRPAGDRRTDAIVVPTGGQGRIPRGLALLQARRADRMLVTGVAREVRPHELALAQGAPPALFDCCVDLGHEAIDTRSNGEETARWLARRRYKSVRLVTTDWHMARARLELAHALPPGIEIVPDAVPSAASLSVLLREYDKYLLRRAAVFLGL